MTTKLTIIMNIHHYWIAIPLHSLNYAGHSAFVSVRRSFLESLFFYRKRYSITMQRLLLSPLLFCAMMHAAQEQKREPSIHEIALYKKMLAGAEKTTYAPNYLSVLAEKKMCWPEIKAFEQRPVVVPGKQRFYASLIKQHKKTGEQTGHLVSGSDAEGVHVVAQQLATSDSLEKAIERALTEQKLDVQQVVDVAVVIKTICRRCDVLLPAGIHVEPCTHTNGDSCRGYWSEVQECLEELVEKAEASHSAFALVPYIRESMILE